MTSTKSISLAELTGTYRLDPARTRLGFVARQTIGGRVRGAFNSFDGQAYLDFADPDRSSAALTVEVASLDTHNARRDKHLRSSDFFDADEHPRITFSSTAVHRLGGDRFQVTGDLTVKHRTRPITIEFSYAGDITDPLGNTSLGFRGRTTVNRKDWGLGWGGVLVRSDVVLEVEVVATRTDA